MPTLEHNTIVEMFRENPQLAPHFLATLLHIDVPPHASVAVVESSLDQLLPVEFRADLVLELRDANGTHMLAIVLEVQRDKDPAKKYSWPVYVAVVRATKRCDSVVLVVAPAADVAAWASENIDLGLGRANVKPLVLGPAVVPEITNPTEAGKQTELTVLSAIAHGNGPNGLAVVLAALTALERLDPEHAAVYFQIVYDALREPMQRSLEAKIMEKHTEAKVTFPPFVQRLIEGGFREGETKGLREGETKGLRNGRIEGLREALLRLVARAGITLTEDDRARILACDDAATLDQWVDNVLGAKTAGDVFS